MSIIIPYDEALIHGDGGFISPNGKITHCFYTTIHEK